MMAATIIIAAVVVNVVDVDANSLMMDEMIIDEA